MEDDAQAEIHPLTTIAPDKHACLGHADALEHAREVRIVTTLDIALRLRYAIYTAPHSPTMPRFLFDAW